jgi:hypothetical protein
MLDSGSSATHTDIEKGLASSEHHSARRLIKKVTNAIGFVEATTSTILAQASTAVSHSANHVRQRTHGRIKTGKVFAVTSTAPLRLHKSTLSFKYSIGFDGAENAGVQSWIQSLWSPLELVASQLCNKPKTTPPPKK